MLRYIEQLIVWLLVFVLVGLAIHTPVSVFVESHWPEYELLVKSWKELLLGVVAILIAVSVWRRGLATTFLRDRFIVLALLIALVHIILVLAFDNYYTSEYAGLLIDLRFYLLFIELYVAARYLEQLRPILLRAAGVGAAIVIAFGVLQVIVLPKDILSTIGYSDTTIKPYLTVDLNHNYIRINSTLRGPNPVGAFAVMVLGLVLAWALRHKERLAARNVHSIVLGALLGGAVLLFASYARSAWLAAVLVVAVLCMMSVSRRVALYGTMTLILGGMLTLGLLFATRDNPIVSNLFFHNNQSGGSVEKSDDGHVTSLQYGAQAMGESPIGHGIGSTGSASLLGHSPVIVENQYFFMAHESGWAGLLLQLAFFVSVMTGLWKTRRNWLSLGLFATGVGLATIGLLLPVWADDTVSLYWWGLAGLALGSSAIIRPHGKDTTKRTYHKKAARTS